MTVHQSLDKQIGCALAVLTLGNIFSMILYKIPSSEMALTEVLSSQEGVDDGHGQPEPGAVGEEAVAAELRPEEPFLNDVRKRKGI